VKQIIVEIDVDGLVKIEAVGFKGGSCEKATKALEEAMGVVGKRTKKPDYYVQQVGQNQVKNGGRI
jgi:hypothetical protein